ncbi:interferon gamma receptor 2 [Manacus candei]|uniref:interferon gamma receptor 2 n=1 Tax=Manacus candei TaxID=415023 RepID=UPI0022266570|nr:interferon gamma receptor 2 [Manacus candei]
MPGRAPLLRGLLFFFLLILVLLLGSAGAEPSPHLPAPEDVEIYSYNFHSLLRWSPVPVERGLVLYTVHYKTGAFPVWNEMNCTRIPRPQCGFPLEIQKRRWTIFLRVRAELGPLPSAWVQAGPFVAERDTTLGPPRVSRVSASSDSLLLSVTPPFMPEPGDSFQYRVFYWENTTRTTKKEQETHNTVFQIGKLKESTLYCFSLQVEFEGVYGELIGQQSAPECHRTAISEATRAGFITLLCLSGLVLINLATAGLLLLWKHRKKIKQSFQPPLKIPSHFEEFLRDPGMPGLEELDNSPEDEPQALVAGEGIQAWSSSPG